jgi:hypothetical protein
VLQQEQARLALNAACFAAGLEAVDFYNAHGNAEAHGMLLLQINSSKGILFESHPYCLTLVKGSLLSFH